MSSNIRAFEISLRASAANIVGPKVATFQRKIALEALSRIVLRTPVDTGRARGNWMVSIGNLRPRFSEKSDKQGQETISRGSAELIELVAFQDIYISNSLPYILRLEHGYSRQAPNGMVSLTLAELGV